MIRTKADQVSKVWRPFFDRFPDISSLANSDSDEISKFIGTLGLRWRATLIGRVANEAFDEFGDAFPTDAAKLSRILPHSEYVTTAVEVMATGFGALPVDVPTARLVNRYFNLQLEGDYRRHRSIKARVESLGDVTREIFLATVDLAALVCVPNDPTCVECPLVSSCAFAAESRAGRQPARPAAC